uniref:non-specific serine/threonine protein kinase n=1 Tax=Melopsittacus undulatus TaxID=13146 RepID=A0A8V5GUD6_MELUD
MSIRIHTSPPLPPPIPWYPSPSPWQPCIPGPAPLDGHLPPPISARGAGGGAGRRRLHSEVGGGGEGGGGDVAGGPNHPDPSRQRLQRLPPPYAVVLISCSGLVAFILLLLTCLCCKRGDVGFKEFENPEGEEDSGDFTPPAEETSSSPSLPDVYVLPLGEVGGAVPSAPPPAPDPSNRPGLSRQRLSYLQEIGTGWFGKVILGELRGDPGPAPVVVQELRAGAGAVEQRRFLSEAEPYRRLQHPHVLQCLGLCGDSAPLLLVMEFCQLGDLKRYLRAQRGSGLGGTGTPPLPPRDVATLQRMALELTRGLRHLHRNGFVHRDLALRNVLLTSELTVRLGDYGLAQSNYREDYYVTPSGLWVPLRWVAPELLGETHGTLVMGEQSKESNVWSLGVTLWELLELGLQPHLQLSDQELLRLLLTRCPLTLPQPRLRLPQPQGWFSLLQSCWLPPSHRPTLDELHLRLRSLLGAPPGVSPPPPPPPPPPRGGSLAFECLWERARGGGARPSSPPPPPHGNGCTLGTPDVLPVLGARSPSGGSEYYIRLEQPGGGGVLGGRRMPPPGAPTAAGGAPPGAPWYVPCAGGTATGPPPPCTCALERSEVVLGWRDRGAPLRPRCGSAGDDSSLRAERGSLLEGSIGREEGGGTWGVDGGGGSEGGAGGTEGGGGEGGGEPIGARGEPIGARGEIIGARGEPIGSRGAPIGSRDAPIGSREVPIESRREPIGSRGEPIGARREPIGARGEIIGARGAPIGSREAPIGSREAPIGSREAPTGSREAIGGAGDVPIGLGDGAMGPGEVLAASRAVGVGTRDVPIGDGDGAVGPGEANGDPREGIEPREVIIEPREVIIEPREVIIEPREVIIEPGEVIVEPREVIIEPREVIIEPREVIIEPGEVIIEPGEVIIEP